MIAIENIRINDIEGLAKEIIRQLPDLEPEMKNIDMYGDYYEYKDFDMIVPVNGMESISLNLDIFGKIRIEGNYRQVQRQTYEQPAEYEHSQENEIWEIKFYVDGEEIEVENEDDLVKKINELL